jgi:site-specific recombinase XerD
MSLQGVTTLTKILEDNRMITKSIYDLEAKVKGVFTELGYTEKALKALCLEARRHIKFHTEHGAEQFDNDIVEEYIKSQETRCQTGKINSQLLRSRKKTAEYFTQIYNTGTIINQKRSHLPELPRGFKNILSDVLSNDEWSHKFKKTQHSRISTFFRWLSLRGHNDLRNVDENIVREYIVDCSTRVVGKSLNEILRTLKILFLFVSPNGELSEQMSKLFMFKARIEEKIKPFMPQNEIAAVLNVINLNTAVGKRDYAIILLAAVTGLRGIDIIELTFDSIDWRNGEIRIAQEKTSTALALPLTTDAGKAIKEYILRARPFINSDKVFLSAVAPFRSITHCTLSQSLQKYRIKAGLAPQIGFHSLRRGLATNMVTSGVSITTVAQTLGHKSIESTKPYISLDSHNLKICALDFDGIPVGGDVQ